ncbi:MAG: methyltransferase domain-containing protein [Brevundimonas sp.]|nr:MAG: methyltransferase domain-containing protein [Brevundimonas sp.]
MRTSFHRIAYEALDVCNALEMAAVDRAVALSGLEPGARALDIGTGNGAVAGRLARRFGMAVTAVERDPAMADLARTRTAGLEVRVAEMTSSAAMDAEGPFNLIVVIGATDPAGPGSREPEAAMERLRENLNPGGFILWGDLIWTDTPPEPLRLIVEGANTYRSDAEYRRGAERAGLEVLSVEMSSDATWDRYVTTMDEAARAWLAAHPEAAEAGAVRTSADRVKAMFDFGRAYIGFGLYLLRRPAE